MLLSQRTKWSESELAEASILNAMELLRRGRERARDMDLEGHDAEGVWRTAGSAHGTPRVFAGTARPATLLAGGAGPGFGGSLPYRYGSRSARFQSCGSRSIDSRQ